MRELPLRIQACCYFAWAVIVLSFPLGADAPGWAKVAWAVLWLVAVPACWWFNKWTAKADL